MQKLMWFAVVFLALLAPSFVLADDAPAAWSGFVFAHAYEQEGGNAELTVLRLKLTRTGTWGGHLDVNAADEGNRLWQLYISRNDGPNSWRVGRVFLAACYSGPVPFLNRMARYPRAALTISAFAYGLQYKRATKAWDIVADVSGNSDKAFDEVGQFERMETSFRISRTITHGLAMASSAQISRDFTRLAFDGEYKHAEANVIGALYYSDEATRVHTLAAFASAEWVAQGWLRPHLQYDIRADGHDILTPGIGFGDPTKKFYAAADYEVGHGGVGLVARVQMRLDF